MKEDNILIKTLYVIKHCFCFSIFGFMSVGYILIMPLIFLFSFGSKKRYLKTCHTINLYAFKTVVFITRNLKFIDIKYKDLGGLKGGKLFACNHISMFDIVAILSSIPDCYTLVNAKFTKNPLLRPIIYSCGYIPVDKDNPSSVIKAYDKVKELLKNGEKVVIFPEGTRTVNGLLQKMQRGAFRISVECDVPVVPVFLTIDRPFINKKMFRRYDLSCVKYRMYFLKPLENRGKDKKTAIRELMKQFSEEMIKASKSDIALPWHKKTYGGKHDVELMEVTEDIIAAKTMVTHDHILLDGHFEGFPIFPGIGQVEFVSQLIKSHLGYKISINKLSRVKFLSKILPDAELKIVVNLKKEGFATWEITNNSEICSKGNLYYSEIEK